MTLLLMVMMAVGSVWGQEIVFHKFGLWKEGGAKEVKSLDFGFKHEKIDQQLKYVRVDWYAVNHVGDVLDGQVSALDKTHTGYYLKSARMTGPAETGKKKYVIFRNVIVTPINVTAIPKTIVLTYMDNTEKVIEITRDNYKQYFPKLKWMDYTAPVE